MRSSDFIARIGGDEFAILISGKITKDGLLTFQKNITEVISAPLSRGAMQGKCVRASPRWPVKFPHLWPGQTPPPERAVN